MATETPPNMCVNSPPAELYADFSDYQIPLWNDDFSDPDYAFEAYV